MADLLLKGGEVVDPSQNIHGVMDVEVRDGSIARVAPGITPGDSVRVIDVSGKLVVPGLIDLHCHVYEGVTETGVNPDLAGVLSGVTTLVDAGSAGCSTFGGFPQYIVAQAKTRVLCLLHISRMGLSHQPDLAGRQDIDLERTVQTIRSNPTLIQGVKLRAVGPAVPTLGIEMVHLAKEAAREGGVRLMVHIGDPDAGDGPTLTRDLLPLLEPGDIMTHLFTDNPGRILDGGGKVADQVLEAQERGVLFDTAHGRMNFSFDLARRVLDQGVTPHTISTDLSRPGRLATVHSMTEMLSRFLALGFTIDDVVRMATANPARALGMEDTLGSLAAGREADVSVLERVAGDWILHDTVGGTLKSETAIVPALTVRAGEVISPDWGPRPWGWLPDVSP